MQKYEGASQVALLPQTTQQVSQVQIRLLCLPALGISVFTHLESLLH